MSQNSSIALEKKGVPKDSETGGDHVGDVYETSESRRQIGLVSAIFLSV
jgi:hypothetical protein